MQGGAPEDDLQLLAGDSARGVVRHGEGGLPHVRDRLDALALVRYRVHDGGGNTQDLTRELGDHLRHGGLERASALDAGDFRPVVVGNSLRKLRLVGGRCQIGCRDGQVSPAKATE